MAHAPGAEATPTDSVHHARGCPDAGASARSEPAGAIRAAVICLVNRERADRHLPPLRQARALDRSAQLWTQTMVQDDIFSQGANFAARISEAGVDWSAAGENIATGFQTPRQVVGGWMASTAHCRNILDPAFRLIGVGLDPHPVRGWANGAATWTQDFALPEGKRAPSEDWGPADGCPY